MKTKKVDVFRDKKLKSVLEHAEIEHSEVTTSVVCAGCGLIASGWGDSEEEAKKRLGERIKGWEIVFDRDVNDGDYPYCPACVKSIFPNLEARLRAQAKGKPLPPRVFPTSQEHTDEIVDKNTK